VAATAMTVGINVPGWQNAQPHQMCQMKGIMMITAVFQSIILFDSSCIG
jgi:hypothetical protein